MAAPNGTNGGSVDVEGSEGDETYPEVIHRDETPSLYAVFHRLIAAILFPDPNCSTPLFHRIKTSIAQNAPLFREASRNTGRSVLLWTRRGSPLRALLVISVSTLGYLLGFDCYLSMQKVSFFMLLMIVHCGCEVCVLCKS